jgi:hypothetical protein
MSFFQTLQKETAEKIAENLDWQKEAAAAAYPLVMVWGQTATGNDAVPVRMKVKVLPPGVEHGEKAGFHAETLGVAGNGEQGFGGGAEEEVVGSLLVVEGDGGEGLRECEDHVEILGGQ